MLPALFIVSQVEMVPSMTLAGKPGIAGLQIRVDRPQGKKCERCWNYSTHVGESAEYPDGVRTLRGRARRNRRTTAPGTAKS